MALVIRMRQQGALGRQHFRIVLTDSRAPRDGKYKEKLGWYDPFGEGEKSFVLDVERLKHWLDVGAQVSDRVRTLVKKKAPEVIKEVQERTQAKLAKKRAQRKKK
jgi:small subunit ribosomal protein S16